MSGPPPGRKGVLEGHGCVDGDQPGDRADAESHPAREVLPRTRGTEDELLERRVCREAYRGIGTCGSVSSRCHSVRPVKSTLPHHLEERLTESQGGAKRKADHWEETPVDPTDALFTNDRDGAVYQSAIPRIRTLRVVDEFRSDITIQPMSKSGSADAHLIVSDGVTAKMASIMPAPRPAVRTVRSAFGTRSWWCQTYLRDSGVQ